MARHISDEERYEGVRPDQVSQPGDGISAIAGIVSSLFVITVVVPVRFISDIRKSRKSND